MVMTLKFEEGFPRRSVDRIQPKRAEDMVRLALDILSPFQDSEAEVLRVETAKGSQEGQKGEMIRDMDARIQSGIW